MKYGWKPEGVESALTDEEEEFKVDKMNYVTNDLQIVKESDARNLADALEKALIDISDTKLDEDPLIYFTSRNKKYLVDFIKFCRKGSFEIG